MQNENYIVVRIFGGLGNQLWQYAFARNLSIQLNKKLILDTSFYDNPLIDLPKGFKAKFELNKFNLHKDVLIQNNIYHHSYRFYKYFLRYLPNKLKNFFFNQTNFKIYHFIFEDNFFKKKKLNFKKLKNGSSYFIGYWQSIDNFIKNSKKIKNELKIKKQSLTLKNYLNNIKNNHVAIHIRGGDMKIEKNYKHPDILYYKKILNKLFKKNMRFEFHIFTDDIVFAKKILKKLNLIKYKIISSKKIFKDLDEFYLMQNYKFLVISRSTFSWWSSFLLNDKKRIIFAPRIWYQNNTMPKGLKLKNMVLI